MYFMWMCCPRWLEDVTRTHRIFLRSLALLVLHELHGLPLVLIFRPFHHLVRRIKNTPRGCVGGFGPLESRPLPR